MHRAEHESSNAERLEFIYLNMVGQTLCVHTVDGAVTEGVFVSRTDDDADHAAILLSRSRNRRSERCTGLDEHQTHDLIAIFLNDIVFLETNAIRVEAAAAGRVEPYRSGMLTEMNWAEIPPEDDRMAGDLETEERQWVAGKWDQFEANKKFGVVSTYSEDQYTTKLDKSKFTREQMALAERLSHEIERSQARGGIQHRIERGEEVEGDEGTLYSDVGRTVKPGAAPSAAADPTKRSTPTTGKSPAYVVPRKGSATSGVAGATGGSTGGSPLTVEEPADVSAAQQQQQSPPTPIEAASPSAASTPSNAAAPAASGVGAKAGSQSSSSLKSLNSNAKPFVPGGGGSATGSVVGVGIGGSAPVGAVHPHGVAPVVIDDMMAAVSKAVEQRNPVTGTMLALLAPPEWLGDDETDDPSIQYFANQTQMLHHGGGGPHQHHAPQHAAVHHHVHHSHHMQHHHMHHHQHHHHHQAAHHHQQPQPQPHGHQQQVMHHHHLPPQSQPQQGMAQHSGGHPQQYHGGGGGFAAQGHFAASQGGAAGPQQYRQSPHSPTGGPGGNVPMQPSGGAGGFGAGGGGGHVDPRNLPPAGAPRPSTMGKSTPQQPQQPIVAPPTQVAPTNSSANAGAGGPSAPVSVSEEPRRGMVVMRGARGAVNPTRHEESPPPQVSAPPTTAQATTAGQIPGASAVVKKKSGK